MLELESRRYWFKTKDVWFSTCPFDITGYDCVWFEATKAKVELAGFRMRTTDLSNRFNARTLTQYGKK